ncbi:MAG TPA: molybdopterin-dependent oxidoreductase [Candidatus Dormibacteraeota bacterium]|nr:molybdopterin-dependent oxidoreductase [Candidatus Dormibacteraeota bacterium]
MAPTWTGALERGTRTVPALCGVCAAGCAVEVVLEDGRIDRLRPRKAHRRGIVCTRGTRAAEIVYSPDRILHPQRRVGERGEGRFERVTWDDAFELWVERMHAIAREHGPEALAIYTGRGNFDFGLNESFAPEGPRESSANAVLVPFGSPNATGVGSLCYVSVGMIAPRACLGAVLRDLHEDVEQASLVLVWGANPATGSPPMDLVRLKAAKARGARVVVIDHQRSETARALDAEWFGVRPGTDGALALGMIGVLIDEDRFDHGFVERWTHGFEALRAYVRRFSPERVETITGVSAERIRELARAIAAADGCSILMYTGLEYSNSGVQAIRAVLTLQAIAGHLDRAGGKRLLPPDRPTLHRNVTPAPASGRPALGAAEFPLYHEVRREAHAALLPGAILEGRLYPVRGLIVSGSSLITSWPEPTRWRRALAALDLLVVIDRFPTADSMYADLRLPAATLFETESFFEEDGHVEHRARVIEPLGEARSDALIFAELARRLGYGDRWPQTEHGFVERALEGTGISYDELAGAADGIDLPRRTLGERQYETGHLRADGLPGFETPTGRFEIASEWLRAAGYEPLPAYTEPAEGPLAAPDVAGAYPLVLNTGARVRSDFRSQHHNVPSLVAMAPAPLATMHPSDAEARGIADGDLVEVATRRGAVTFRARVTDDIVPGVVEANMGGGGPLGPEAWRTANVNELTDAANVDPISGFPVYKALLCEVRLAGSAAGAGAGADGRGDAAAEEQQGAA